MSVFIFFVNDQALVSFLLDLNHGSVFLAQSFPGRALNHPLDAFAFWLGVRIVSYVAKLHRDFLVSLQEQSDGHGQQEVVKWEHKDKRPRIVETLVDWVVLGCIANAESESNDSEDGSDECACFFNIGSCHEIKHDNHHDKEGQDGHIEGSDARYRPLQHIDQPVHVREDAERVHDSEAHEQ